MYAQEFSSLWLFFVQCRIVCVTRNYLCFDNSCLKSRLWALTLSLYSSTGACCSVTWARRMRSWRRWDSSMNSYRRCCSNRSNWEHYRADRPLSWHCRGRQNNDCRTHSSKVILLALCSTQQKRCLLHYCFVLPFLFGNKMFKPSSYTILAGPCVLIWWIPSTKGVVFISWDQDAIKHVLGVALYFISQGYRNVTRGNWKFTTTCPTGKSFLNSYSASRDNWCTATLWNRIMTAQCEGMGEVGSVRYEPALLPPCPSIRVLSYSNCQEIHSRQQTGLAV